MIDRRIISDLEELYREQVSVEPFSHHYIDELGLTIVQHPDVLTPKFSYSGVWTVKNWDLEPGMSVLDIGTGTGVMGVSALLRARVASVLSTDISSTAVECATRTAALNGVSDKMRVIRSNLFDELSGSGVDRIVFNPPFWNSRPDPNRPITYASNDPSRSVLKKFLEDVPGFLAHTDSRVIIVFSTQDNFMEVDRMIREANGLIVKRTFSEEIGHNRVLYFLGRD